MRNCILIASFIDLIATFKVVIMQFFQGLDILFTLHRHVDILRRFNVDEIYEPKLYVICHAYI